MNMHKAHLDVPGPHSPGEQTRTSGVRWVTTSRGTMAPGESARERSHAGGGRARDASRPHSKLQILSQSKAMRTTGPWDIWDMESELCVNLS